MKKTARYYKANPKAKAKKAATDKKINARPKQKAKRAELGRKRTAAKKAGKNIKGKDASHTKRGIVFKSPSANRGSKTDSAGDRRARGNGCKKKK